MSTSNPERVYKDISAATCQEMVSGVEMSIRQLEHEFEWVTVLSVSHSVFTSYNGGFIWTAFITCLAEGKQPESDT